MDVMEKLNTLPKDVKNSLEKIETLLNIIECNVDKGKDYTIVELIEEFGSLERARKIFENYYFLDKIGLSKYILELRKSKLKNTLSHVPLIDIDIITSNIISIYDSLDKIYERGYAKIDINRTNIKITKRKSSFLKEILSMREYISIEEYRDIKELINFNMFLENYEYMEEEIRKSKTYDPMYIMDLFVKRQNKFEDDERYMRMAEFIICYDKYVKVNIKGLVYYTVDRSKYKSAIEKFILPENLNNYVSICSKTNCALKLLSRRYSDWYYYINQFKYMLGDNLERVIFAEITLIEETCMEKTLKDIHQELSKNRKYLKKVHIENALKSLIIKGFVSLRR